MHPIEAAVVQLIANHQVLGSLDVVGDPVGARVRRLQHEPEEGWIVITYAGVGRSHLSYFVDAPPGLGRLTEMTHLRTPNAPAALGNVLEGLIRSGKLRSPDLAPGDRA